jgi:hypothetical protein
MDEPLEARWHRLKVKKSGYTLKHRCHRRLCAACAHPSLIAGSWLFPFLRDMTVLDLTDALANVQPMTSPNAGAGTVFYLDIMQPIAPSDSLGQLDARPALKGRPWHGVHIDDASFFGPPPATPRPEQGI